MSKRSRDFPSEIEAKLAIPDIGELRRLTALRRLGVYRLVPRDVVALHTVYFDTPDLALTRSESALRARRENGRWEVTGKWDECVRGGVHERTEVTLPLDTRPGPRLTLPPGVLQQRLAAIVAGRPLTPVLVSEIRRRRIDVFGDGREEEPTAEIDVDRVILRAPQPSASADAPRELYFEIEIEQRGGERDDVQEIARLLKRGFDLHTSALTKFARGMRLLHGAKVLERRDVTLADTDTVGTAVGKLMDVQLQRLRQQDAQTRRDEDPEGLHAMRVAVRRLRALLRLFEAGVGSRQAQSLQQELRWLGQELGAVRDLDVQIERLQHDSAISPPGHRKGYAGLMSHLRSERRKHFPQLLEALDSARYFALLLQIEKLAAQPPRRLRSAAIPGSAPSFFAGAAHDALKTTFKRLRRRADKVRSLPSPEDLHALRIRAKRMRYLLEFLRDLSGKKGGRLVRRLVKLQDLLGHYHDAVVAADAIRSYVERAGPQQAANLMALGTLAGQHVQQAEALRARFDSAWSRFVRARNLDLLDAVLRRLKKAHRAAVRQASIEFSPGSGEGRHELHNLPSPPRYRGRRPGRDERRRPNLDAAG